MDEFTPIIFLTARSQTTDVVKGFEIGANDYLKKPFKMEELFRRVGNALERNVVAGRGTVDVSCGFHTELTTPEHLHVGVVFDLMISTHVTDSGTRPVDVRVEAPSCLRELTRTSFRFDPRVDPRLRRLRHLELRGRIPVGPGRPAPRGSTEERWLQRLPVRSPRAQRDRPGSGTAVFHRHAGV